jgi:hypothetical protein
MSDALLIPIAAVSTGVVVIVVAIAVVLVVLFVTVSMRGRQRRGAKRRFSSCSRPSALPALCTTLRRNSCWVLTSRSAISIAASSISRRRDGRSPCGNAGNASSTTSTNLRTDSITARDPRKAWPDRVRSGARIAGDRFRHPAAVELATGLATLRRFTDDELLRNHLIRGRSLPRFGVLDARDRNATNALVCAGQRRRLLSPRSGRVHGQRETTPSSPEQPRWKGLGPAISPPLSDKEPLARFCVVDRWRTFLRPRTSVVGSLSISNSRTSRTSRSAMRTPTRCYRCGCGAR